MANELYRMYNEMLEGHKTKNDGLFEHGVRCWMDLSEGNPFPEDTAAYTAYERVRNYYGVWRMGGPDYRVSRKRMLAAAHELCELYPKKPYKFDREAERADKAIKAEQEAKRQEAMKEAEAKQIEEEAERIIAEERARQKEAQMREKARKEFEKAEAEEKEAERRYAEALQKAIEEKRAAMLEEQEEEIQEEELQPEEETRYVSESLLEKYGVVQTQKAPVVLDIPAEKVSWFRRIFGKRR